MARLQLAALRSRPAETEQRDIVGSAEASATKTLSMEHLKDRTARALAKKEAHSRPVEPVAAQATPALVEPAIRSVAPAHVPVPDTSSTEDWTSLLKLNGNGYPYANTGNMLVTMRHAPALAGSVAYDTFLHSLVRVRNIDADACSPATWTSADTTAVEVWVHQNTDMTSMSDKAVAKAVALVGQETHIDTLQEHIQGLPKHDGEGRLDSWLIDYAGAEDTPETRAIGRKFLIGMVERAMDPGCECKRSLILFGEQGVGKSSLCRILVGDPSWMDSGLRDINNEVTTGNQLRSKWLVEISEGVGIGKADQNALKSFLSRREDKFTPKFSNDETVIQRRVSFVVTTNDDEILNDPTGHTRWMPVRARQVRFDQLEADRDQLFAEAYAAYLVGERNQLPLDMAEAVNLLCAEFTVVGAHENAV
ncbi:MAG: hypothetical protein JNK19_03790, partial [Tabrizicola sp.]|nr:hypothetical protein [Tabrizicola sp.]